MTMHAPLFKKTNEHNDCRIWKFNIYQEACSAYMTFIERWKRHRIKLNPYYCYYLEQDDKTMMPSIPPASTKLVIKTKYG